MKDVSFSQFCAVLLQVGYGIKSDSSRGFWPPRKETVTNLLYLNFKFYTEFIMRKTDRVPKGLTN